MNVFIDWQYPFHRLFVEFMPKRILEIGVGVGTKFLVEHGKLVISLELLKDEDKRQWYDLTCEELKYKPNWSGFLLECEDKMTPEVEEWLLKYMSQGWDLIFVDPGVHFRPEIINLCFGNCKVVAAHDTSWGEDDYHWDRVEAPEDYHKVALSSGQGTTFWTKDKELADRL